MSQWLDRITARHIVWLCVASAVVRCAFVLAIEPAIPTAEDVAIARHIAAGNGFAIYDRGPTTIKGPLYPTFVALWLRLLGERDGLRAVVLVQHLLTAVVPFLLYLLGGAIRRQRLGTGAALLFILHPSYFYHPTVAENTAWVVCMGCFWCVVLFRFEPKRFPPLATLILGTIIGAFVLEKPPLVVPMLIACVLRFYRWWKRLALVGVAAAVVVLPWAVRGWIIFGKPTLTKSYSGYLTFIHSWLPSMAVHPRYAVADSVEHVLDSLGRLPETDALPALRTLANSIARERWQQLPERTLVHALVYWTIPPRYWGNWSVGFIVARLVPVVFLLVLFVWGAIVLWRDDRTLLLAIGGVLLWTTAFYSLYHVLNIRYKLEVEWLQLLVCAAPLVWESRTP
ncbi:MAG: glycosyltransferase family 39 protein [Chlorobi bacterium]|nr:glycosyltransferase family 39 protein [Chlorobiota bacterium]